MKQVTIRPKAALYLTGLVNQIQNNGYFFEASRKFNRVTKIYAENPHITTHEGWNRIILALSFITPSGFKDDKFLSDKNLEKPWNGYNDWFCFATKHEAKKYVHAPFVK